MLRARRQVRTAVAAFAAFAIAWACAVGARPRVVDEASVHAAYAINFLRYARWPDGAGSGPLVVAVVGPAHTVATFRGLARSAGSINGRPVIVRAVPVNVAAPARREAVRALRERLQGAHLVYVAPSHEAWQRAVIEGVGEQPAITVGAGADFVARGGMFGFHRDRGRVHFAADPGRIAAAHIDMSAHVLRLARPLDGD